MQPQATLLFAMIALLAATPADAAKCPRGSLTGVVTHVRDGDTIVVGTMPIRLNGLAAPEGDEPGGSAATPSLDRETYLVQPTGHPATMPAHPQADPPKGGCVGLDHLVAFSWNR